MMDRYQQKIENMGLFLPDPLVLPQGVVLPFPFVNVRGDRARISGHGPQNPDGSLAGPFGSVGKEVSPEEACTSAKLTGLSILASLKRELGSLERIIGWSHAFCMVKCAPGFENPPMVANGFSDLILEVFGNDIGRHARSAIGAEVLPFGIPVEIEGEVLISS